MSSACPVSIHQPICCTLLFMTSCLYIFGDHFAKHLNWQEIFSTSTSNGTKPLTSPVKKLNLRTGITKCIWFWNTFYVLFSVLCYKKFCKKYILHKSKSFPRNGAHGGAYLLFYNPRHRFAENSQSYSRGLPSPLVAHHVYSPTPSLECRVPDKQAAGAFFKVFGKTKLGFKLKTS